MSNLGLIRLTKTKRITALLLICGGLTCFAFPRISAGLGEQAIKTLKSYSSLGGFLNPGGPYDSNHTLTTRTDTGENLEVKNKTRRNSGKNPVTPTKAATRSSTLGRTTVGPPTNVTMVTLIADTDPFLMAFNRTCAAVSIPSTMSAPPNGKHCPCVPPGLVGRRFPDVDEPSWEALEASHPEVELGGHWSPSSCVARQRACVLIPYRDREAHLKIWLKHTVPFMQKQNVDFKIFLAEQNNGSRFNRGMLINVAFAQAVKAGVSCDCVIVHDVDHLPEDDRTMYFCQNRPIHLAVARNSGGYRLPYRSFIGGAMALPSRQFKSHNGFSNLYFGWGSEDDDVYERITKVLHRPVIRYPENIARYTMIKHKHAEPNMGRWKLVRSWRSRWSKDGLNNVMERCSVSKIEKRKLFTHIFVNIDEKMVKEGTGYT